MSVLLIIGILIGILIVLEMFKHHFTKNLFKYLMIFVIVLFTILILSAYIDLGSFFSKDNTFSQTGEVIAEGVSEDVEKIDFNQFKIFDILEEKTKEILNKLLDS